jgi:hypothetical protein
MLLDTFKTSQNTTQQPEKKKTESVEKQGLSLKEFCTRVGCSESHGWKMLRLGQLKSVSFGRRRIIPASEIERVLGGESA